MIQNRKPASVRSSILLTMLLLNGVIVRSGYLYSNKWYWLLLVSLPLLLTVLVNIRQKKHTLLKNYPLLAYGRYWLERIRPEIRQYFFESDLSGKPFNRRQRSIVYQRSKNERQTVAFGMQTDPNTPGFEWMAHSIYPVVLNNKDLRVWIGNDLCRHPYHASIFNIGAMSYGALSKTAITALNEGAKRGNFAHNTGEGGISDYHLNGGDLIWQIGTGYFGCRDNEGRFNPAAFRRNALRPQVKMIELKLSQGAKPGHGGILPGSKNTPEIAAIRQVEPGATIHSPAQHTEFDNPQGLVNFLQLLRELSDGKPVGFKICIGNKQEFISICYTIKESGYLPDFITIDGGEGGTGAAPLEFTDHLGMPLYDALAFVKKVLLELNLSDHIKIIAAGKIITGFDILKVLSLGAAACYSARGMMFSLGCIQALTCDSGKCPVGIATQNPSLYKGLDPTDKANRVYNFHLNTIQATKEMMEACGIKDVQLVKPSLIYRKTDEQTTRSFEDIYFDASIELTKKQNYQSLLN